MTQACSTTLLAQMHNVLPLLIQVSIFTSLTPQLPSPPIRRSPILSSMPRRLLPPTIHSFLQPTLDMSTLRCHSQGEDDAALETQVRVQYILTPDLVDRAPRFPPSLPHCVTLFPGNATPLSRLAFSFGTLPAVRVFWPA